MATYGPNILPTEAAYYTLNNASLSGGVLSLQAGGSAAIHLDKSRLTALTEWFRVSLYPSAPTDNYAPWLYMYISATDTKGVSYNFTCMPTETSSGIFTAELEFEASDYTSATVVLYSTKVIDFTLWELCPEASDADIQVIIDGVEQSLPRLLYDYNMWPLSVYQKEATISLISCNLIENTDLQGHLSLTYVASEPTTLTLRFKDTEATELFAPMLYDLHAGRGTVGVPHSYLHRKAGLHNFTVTAQVTKGHLTIGTRGLLFTLDGGYLAERMLDVGSNVSDITVEHKRTDYEPSYIWVIGIEAGEVLVRRRAYSIKTSGVAFEPMYSFGKGIEGAIEFDGDWYLDTEATDVLYQLDTYDNPYCFFIDEEHNLYVQRGADESTRYLLDTNVDSVSVCRGYKSSMYPEQDQGLICLYIKEGAAWYRQYAYSAIEQRKLWFGAIQVMDIPGTVLNAHVNRLNDYRVGFAITTETDNYWLLSDRTYVGQSFKPETLYFAPTSIASVGLYSSTNIPILNVTGALSNDRLAIIATFNYPIRCLAYDPIELLVIPSELRGEYDDNIEGIIIADNKLIIRVKERILKPYTISFVSTAAWQFLFNSSWQAFVPTVSFTYDPYGRIEAQNQSQGRVRVSVRNMNATVELTPLGRPKITYNDTVNIAPTMEASITHQAIRREYNEVGDTALFIATQLEATVTLQQTGEQPI